MAIQIGLSSAVSTAYICLQQQKQINPNKDIVKPHPVFLPEHTHHQYQHLFAAKDSLYVSVLMVPWGWPVITCMCAVSHHSYHFIARIWNAVWWPCFK